MKHILLLALLLCSTILSAQTLIVTTEGDPITGYEVEVTKNGVFYKAEDSADSPFVKLDKRTVLVIRNADGSVVNLSEPDAPTTPEKTVVADEAPTQKQMNPDDYLDHEYNKEIIAKYNTLPIVTFEKEKDKKGDVNRVILQHYATEDSQFASKDLVVSYVIKEDNVYTANGNKRLPWIDGYKYNFLPRVHIQLENKSDKSIYIDLANTFIIRNGESTPYYTPGATSSTGGVTSGASVNLGGVANAVGLGGAVGAMAKGVNVGSSTSKYTTNITYAQRIIVIPPKSITKLEGKDLIISKEFRLAHLRYEVNWSRMLLNKKYYPENIGDFVEWDLTNTIYKISHFLTYSFSEDFSESYNLSSTLYPKRIVGSRMVTRFIPTVVVEMEGSSMMF